MEAKEVIVKQVRAALEHAAGINLPAQHVEITFAGGLVTLYGEVPSLAGKKLALEAAGMVSGVRGVVDKMRVGSLERAGPGDGAVRESVCELLLRDINFRNCAIAARVKGALELRREPAGERCGRIEIAASDGVVRLSGEVISLTHKRLAGVLAWWASGVRDVNNRLEVNPPEEDTDDEITDALRLVLETDPRVHSEQIGIQTRDHVVTLAGVVASADERRVAEQDAWYLYAVDRVVNHLEVRR